MCCAATPAFADAPPAEHWELLYKHGSVSLSRDDTGKLPAFKAEGVIEANLFDVLAVLSDIPHRTEWMKDLERTRIVSGDVESKVVIYEEYHLPWPVQNRDSVVESTIHQDLKELEVDVDYHEVTSNQAPVRVGIVRMPAVRGSMVFRYIDETHAYARVIIELDVGGALPKWAVKRFVKEAPVMTLDGLVKQVAATQGHYAEFIKRHVAEAHAQSQVAFQVDPRSLGGAP